MSDAVVINDVPSASQSVLSAVDGRPLETAALQCLALALSLTLQNAVADQQQGQILRTALTTAAAKAILQGKKAEAEELLALAQSRLVVPDPAAMISDVQRYLDVVEKHLHDSRHSAA